MNLSKEEQQNLRDFLVAVYGSQVKSWNMNDSVFNLTYKMVAESKKCSDAMDFVPRPVATMQSPIKYLSKIARGILLRKLKNNKQQYKICIKVASLKFRTAIQLASMGL